MKPDDPLYEPVAAATYLCVKAITLQWWRTMGRGPVYLKVGRRVLYRKSALDGFLAAGVREPDQVAS
jgi:hypothetical protein